MSNDTFRGHRTPSVPLSPPDPEIQPEDMRGGTPDPDSKTVLILPAGPARLDDVFSLETLRIQCPDPQDRVENIWCFLAREILDRFGEDRRLTGLAMLDELISLSGFSIGEHTRAYFEEMFLKDSERVISRTPSPPERIFPLARCSSQNRRRVR